MEGEAPGRRSARVHVQRAQELALGAVHAAELDASSRGAVRVDVQTGVGNARAEEGIAQVHAAGGAVAAGLGVDERVALQAHVSLERHGAAVGPDRREAELPALHPRAPPRPRPRRPLRWYRGRPPRPRRPR